MNRGFIESVNTYRDDSELDETISKINEKRKERPWWDPLGVFEEEEVEEKTDEEKYNESKSDDDKPWGELSDDEKKDFLKKNAKIEYSKTIATDKIEILSDVRLNKHHLMLMLNMAF